MKNGWKFPGTRSVWRLLHQNLDRMAAIICIKIVESMVNCISRWNSLECFNRVWNSQVGQHPNVWKVIDAFIKTELEYRRILLLNAIGKDLHQKYRKEGEIR